MRSIFLSLSLIIFSSSFAEDKVMPKKLTWNSLSQLEKKMEKWANKVGSKELVVIGKMKQRPEEVAVVRSLFPYLLPEGFFGRHLDMTCYPHFYNFQKKKSLKSHKQWVECLHEVYNDSFPPVLTQATKDLRPE